jgi:hypothetical protein
MITFRHIEFKEMGSFSGDAARLLNDSELSALQRTLSLEPEKGDLIRHTGGARKIRVALRGRGKRGGGRVVYYYQLAEAIHFLFIYAKNEQEDLTPGQVRMVREIVGLIKEGAL